MKIRLASLALAFAFLAAPALGAVSADACMPCCPGMESESGDAHCGTDAGSCEHLAAESCCKAAPAAPARVSTRSIDAPSLQPVLCASSLAAVTPLVAANPHRAAAVALRSSPRRLSVVLLI
jgi:hypothetical protein